MPLGDSCRHGDGRQARRVADRQISRADGSDIGSSRCPRQRGVSRRRARALLILENTHFIKLFFFFFTGVGEKTHAELEGSIYRLVFLFRDK